MWKFFRNGNKMVTAAAQRKALYLEGEIQGLFVKFFDLFECFSGLPG